MPCFRKAGGSAPITSPRPPVFTKGNISEATESILMPSRSEIVDHALRDQANTVICSPKALRIEGRVFADHQSFGNENTAIDNHIVEARASAHYHFGENDRVLDT